jgi:hypothetical protein
MMFLQHSLDKFGILLASDKESITELCHECTETSEKESTCISPFMHPNKHVITCSSFMWLEIHASTEEFTLFLYVRTPLVTAYHNLFPCGQKDALTSLLIHAD